MEACDWGCLKGSLLSLHLPSFIYLFSYSVDCSSLSVGILGGEGAAPPFPLVRGTSRVVCMSVNKCFWLLHAVRKRRAAVMDGLEVVGSGMQTSMRSVRLDSEPWRVSVQPRGAAGTE
jgi:hypothetical protein